MQALVELEHSRAGGLTADQRTAGGQIQKQLAWINGHADVEAPSKEAAMERERE